MLYENDLFDKSQQGLKIIELSIIELLNRFPNGLGNSEIADRLGLHSSHEGKQKDYLTYSILGNLMKNQKIDKYRIQKRTLYRNM